MERKHMIIKGHVQGVGFRGFTQSAASDIGVTGWVRNDNNGTVEIEAQADPDRLERFLRIMRQGSSWSHIQEVKVNTLHVREDEHEFRVFY
jgi:acylphosphatase